MNVAIDFPASPTVGQQYTFNGVTQSKPITRQVFQSPGTVCQ